MAAQLMRMHGEKLRLHIVISAWETFKSSKAEESSQTGSSGLPYLSFLQTVLSTPQALLRLLPLRPH
jgi:hypothetical protein